MASACHKENACDCLCREALELAPGEAAVVTNGRVILASRLAAGLEAGDFALLDLYAANFQHASQVGDTSCITQQHDLFWCTAVKTNVSVCRWHAAHIAWLVWSMSALMRLK